MDWFEIIKAYNREHYVKAGQKHNDEETINRHTKILEEVARSPIKNKKMGRGIRRIVQNQKELSHKNKSTKDIKSDIKEFVAELSEYEMRFARFNRWKIYQKYPNLDTEMKNGLNEAQDLSDNDNRIFARTIRPITDAIHYKTKIPVLNITEMYNMVSVIRERYKTPEEIVTEVLDSQLTYEE
tara:strand:+ start:114 stop:662 length:549 start_codon:yes stop_codon:yes gene_type:complete